MRCVICGKTMSAWDECQAQKGPPTCSRKCAARLARLASQEGREIDFSKWVEDCRMKKGNDDE